MIREEAVEREGRGRGEGGELRGRGEGGEREGRGGRGEGGEEREGRGRGEGGEREGRGRGEGGEREGRGRGEGGEREGRGRGEGGEREGRGRCTCVGGRYHRSRSMLREWCVREVLDKESILRSLAGGRGGFGVWQRLGSLNICPLVLCWPPSFSFHYFVVGRGGRGGRGGKGDRGGDAGRCFGHGIRSFGRSTGFPR